ncbi:glycosyltransferase [Frigoribacterium sp. 2-23]|uniref:glycosyltransferase n=1 Tax=Frigoribacterium sp. 2-23 TaxID=3415006 RepID=UPI003C702C9E
MLASIVVVDWKQPELTRRCLDSLVRQEGAEKTEIVLVVNEASADDVAAYRSEFPAVRVVPVAHNAGFAGGVAAGAAVSDSDVIVLVNNDAVALPGFLRSGLSALERGGPGLAAVAGTAVLEGTFAPTSVQSDDQLVGLDGQRWSRAGTSAGVTLLNGTGVEVTRDGNGFDRDWLTPVPAVDVAGLDRPRDPFGFSGGAVFLRREALDGVGGFDESLFMYYEDLDVAWRLRLAGFGIGWSSDAIVVHRHAGSSSSNGGLVRYQSMRNRLAVSLRVGSPALRVRVVLRTAARLVRDVLPGPDRQLSRRQWAHLLGELPRLAAHASRRRRADGFSAADRRRVEALLLP